MPLLGYHSPKPEPPPLDRPHLCWVLSRSSKYLALLELLSHGFQAAWLYLTVHVV